MDYTRHGRLSRETAFRREARPDGGPGEGYGTADGGTLLHGTLAGTRVALIGFADTDGARLADALTLHDAFVRRWSPHDVQPGSMILQRFELLVVQLSGALLGSVWADHAVLAASERPTVFVGTAADLTALGPTICHTGHDFLVAPVSAEELLLRACHLLRAATPIVTPTGAPASPAAAARVQPVFPPAEMPAPPVRDALPSHVLVADDDATVVALLSATLCHYGIDCQAASNGQDALDMARDTRPDALVLDVNMPQLDGFAVLAALRNDPTTAHLAIVMLSARQQETDVLRGFGLGADDYVVKPFNPMELAMRLKRMLRGRR
jgi:CheY-like chemotaxis protein